MKISICTINGGGTPTMLRMAESFNRNVVPSLKNYDWNWTILAQGDKGMDLRSIHSIKRISQERVNILRYPRNIGTVWATNELISWSTFKQCDIFWMIDDDMVMRSGDIVSALLHPIITKNKATSAAHVCWFGNKDELTQKYNTVGDHGSGCTMYPKDVFVKCGFHNEELVQYAHDTEFNNRIKIAFGPESLCVCNQDFCIHHNQTGTRNCFQPDLWEYAVKRDSQYLMNIKYGSNAYTKRLIISENPLWDRENFVSIF